MAVIRALNDSVPNGRRQHRNEQTICPSVRCPSARLAMHSNGNCHSPIALPGVTTFNELQLPQSGPKFRKKLKHAILSQPH